MTLFKAKIALTPSTSIDDSGFIYIPTHNIRLPIAGDLAAGKAIDIPELEIGAASSIESIGKITADGIHDDAGAIIMTIYEIEDGQIINKIECPITITSTISKEDQMSTPTAGVSIGR